MFDAAHPHSHVVHPPPSPTPSPSGYAEARAGTPGGARTLPSQFTIPSSSAAAPTANGGATSSTSGGTAGGTIGGTGSPHGPLLSNKALHDRIGAACRAAQLPPDLVQHPDFAFLRAV